ncbi:MAG: 2-hydroxyacyl-CoA dehydratase [Clostridia bacterium]|nr:2-hydroxyacyl-CoA dehydratase [Clostridia bacterium]
MTRSAVEQLVETASLTGREIMERYPDRQFFGFTCSYWPEELVLAAGMEPLRLFPVNTRAMPPELPSFSCSLARGVLAELKGTGLKKLAGLGQAQTCDTMQCLGSIAQGAFPEQVLELVPPVLLAAPGAREYYHEELKALWQKLLGLSGEAAKEENIAAALNIFQRMRQLVRQVDEMRPRLPSPLVASLLRAGQLMPRQEYVTLLEEAVTALAGYEETGTGKIGILLSGPVLEKDSLYLMIEELGGRVLVDDTCTGTRHYAEDPAEEAGAGRAGSVEGLLEQVARRHLTMPLCPCRHRRLEERSEYLQSQARERGVRGAILVVRKYCEPHAFDAVPVAKALQQQGIKALVLELEGADVGGQERTRLQAFLESLG